MKYEVFSYDGIGYQKLMVYKDWRIAILNYIDELEIENLSYVEAHHETDEAFILLKGEATLIFADVENSKITGFTKLNLEPNKVYNIKKNIYHTHTLSKDCQLLIVEEENTSDFNSHRIYFNDHTKKELKEIFK